MGLKRGLVLFLLFSAVGFSRTRIKSRASYLDAKIPALSAASLFPSAPGLSAVGLEAAIKEKLEQNGMMEMDSGEINLDSFESVGSFSTIEQEQDELFGNEDLIEAEQGETSAMKTNEAVLDYTHLFERKSSFLDIEDHLKIEDPIQVDASLFPETDKLDIGTQSDISSLGGLEKY